MKLWHWGVLAIWIAIMVGAAYLTEVGPHWMETTWQAER